MGRSCLKVLNSSNDVVKFKDVQIENESSVYKVILGIVGDEEIINISFDNLPDYFGIEVQYNHGNNEIWTMTGCLQTQSNIDEIIKTITT